MRVRCSQAFRLLSDLRTSPLTLLSQPQELGAYAYVCSRTSLSGIGGYVRLVCVNCCACRSSDNVASLRYACNHLDYLPCPATEKLGVCVYFGGTHLNIVGICTSWCRFHWHEDFLHSNIPCCMLSSPFIWNCIFTVLYTQHARTGTFSETCHSSRKLLFF